MNRLYCWLILAASVMTFAGCKKSNDYPLEPVIEFKSLSITPDLLGYDDYAVLEITFTDGDGDIGLGASDTVPPFINEYKYNVIILFYCDTSGNGLVHWSAFDDKGRIPVVTPEGNTKAIRGEIKKETIFLPNHRTNMPVRFEVYIYDRALHKSNVLTTPTFIVNTQ